MKTHKRIHLLTLTLALIALPSAAIAQNGEARGNQRESRMLMHLLKMDDSELMKLRQTVERIEAMSPEERADMRERLGKLQEMDAERRQALRERFEAIPPEKREAMRRRWMEMSPMERREWRQKLRNMSPEERAQAMEEADFIPPRHMGKKRGNKQGPPPDRKGPPPPLAE